MAENEAVKANDNGRIDIISFLNDVLNRLRSFWWVILILTLGVGAAFYFRSTTTYTPSYSAEATVSVHIKNGGTYSNENTAEQMGKVFPYILTSGALSDIIAADLGVSHVPGSISVKNIEGTNLLTVTVTGSDPDKVYKVLQSVLRNYPEVARYVVGQTEIVVVDDNGVPEDTGKTAVVRGSLMKGLLLGLALGILGLLLYTLLTRTVRSEKDLTSMLNVNFLGTLPVVRRGRGENARTAEINILTGPEKSAYTEAMRVVRTRLERQMDETRILMVTSSIPGEGKSTVAANLAISFAEKGRKVILIDCDLRLPSIAAKLGLSNSVGLSNYLAGTENNNRLRIYHFGDPQFEVSPAGSIPPDPTALLSSDSMKTMLDELKNTFNYDYIILDFPPVFLVSDAVLLSDYIDGYLVVVRQNSSEYSKINETIQQMEFANANIIGFVFNGKTHEGAIGKDSKYYKYKYQYYK